jgi:hypothetical protein
VDPHVDASGAPWGGDFLNLVGRCCYLLAWARSSDERLVAEVRALFALCDLLYGELTTITSRSWRYESADAVADQRQLRISLCRHRG